MAISKKLLNDGERLVLSMRTHPKALFGPLVAMIVFLAVGVAVQRLFDERFATWAGWVVAGLGVLWYSVRPLLQWLAAVHAITDRRLISRWGIITRRGRDIPLSRISDVSLEINLIDRPFGCGTLVISNAADGNTVLLHDIPRVERTKLQLHNLIHEIQDGRRAGEGA